MCVLRVGALAEDLRQVLRVLLGVRVRDDDDAAAVGRLSKRRETHKTGHWRMDTRWSVRAQ